MSFTFGTVFLLVIRLLDQFAQVPLALRRLLAFHHISQCYALSRYTAEHKDKTHLVLGQLVMPSYDSEH